ncbi:DUF3347 domain-containing protein [Litoribacter alkaliphilus]|uniref:DUF3347 domain-containing protein n=1 Tax=Litoribacter ruber TaxID=702568 RepID=A0AAP2G347_9BACT|nr:DUF3347 domain-containing protein [Litoribacter alkaliphilus]MBS9523070.1 DUF3347 domain-containing protein [Litoribacter alkaliphilus]
MKKVFIAAALMGLFIACENKPQEDDHQGHAHHDDGSSHVAAEDAGDATEVHADFAISKHSEVEQVKAFYSEYLNLKNALVANDKEASDKAVQNLQGLLNNDNFNSMEGRASAVVSQMGSSLRSMDGESVEGKREELNTLSMSLFTMLKAADHGVENAHLQYCPMAFNDQGAYWVSDVKEIRNPYFGDKMLKCGSVKESI